MATTKTVLRDEIAMLQFAKDGQRKFRPLVSSPSATPAFDGLSDEQKKAALHILKSRDTVTGVVGKAGTGKTTMMRATIDAIRERARSEGVCLCSLFSGIARRLEARRI